MIPRREKGKIRPTKPLQRTRKGARFVTIATEEGHFARDCPKPRQEGQSKGSGKAKAATVLLEPELCAAVHFSLFEADSDDDAFSETSLDFSEADWREMVEREGLEPELSPLEVAEGSSLDVAESPVEPSEGNLPLEVAQGSLLDVAKGSCQSVSKGSPLEVAEGSSLDAAKGQFYFKNLHDTRGSTACSSMYIGQQQHDMHDVAFAAPSDGNGGEHWLLDSGASVHLVSQSMVESGAAVIVERLGASSVGCVTATGDAIQVQFKARVRARMLLETSPQSGACATVTFEALVAPVQFSLLSVGRLLEKGWNVDFGGSSGRASVCVGSTALKVVPFQKCFWLESPPRSESSSAALSASPDVFVCRGTSEAHLPANSDHHNGGAGGHNNRHSGVEPSCREPGHRSGESCHRGSGFEGQHGEQGRLGDHGEQGRRGFGGDHEEQGRRGFGGDHGGPGRQGFLEESCHGEQGFEGQHGGPGRRGFPGDHECHDAQRRGCVEAPE